MPDVDIAIARPEERPVLANMMQFYVHDFSEHWAGLPTGELEPDGRFIDYPLDPYWRDPGHVPLLFRIGGHLAGFALINDHSHSDRPVERNMAEFFVVRKHRRGGVGTAAVHGVFSLYPGLWEAAVARRNLSALAFWRAAVRSHPRARDIEEDDFATDHWNGPILRFRIAA